MVRAQALRLRRWTTDRLAGLGDHSSFYVAVIGIAAWMLKPNPAAILAVVVPATLILLLVTARTTRGGWRWRWGEPD